MRSFIYRASVLIPAMSDIPPNVRVPTLEELREKAAKHHISLGDDELADIHAELVEMLEFYERIDELPDPRPEQRHHYRERGYHPDEDEDPYNAFVTKCLVPGADDGLLDGYDVGIKDNVSVAGVEMTCGSKSLWGHVPINDATVVKRLLNAGATITGKLNMENMAYSGSGELSATGPVLNPHNPEYLTGGSSSGSAAAVAAGEVDVAIGSDQGGSIRSPAAWCGCVGLKPTHGLVPYTGAAGFGHTFDHLGPITETVEDCARVLQAIAGSEADDPRQHPGVGVGDYLEAIEDPDAGDVTVHVVAEGFGLPESEAVVDDGVHRALDQFEVAGAAVEDCSIPYHEDGEAIWTGVTTEALAGLMRDEGMGHFHQGYYDTQFQEAIAKARRTRADDFPPTMKLILSLGQYLADEYHGHYHAKSQNLRQDLAAAYTDALDEVDVLAMPTVPHRPHSVEDDLERSEIMARAGTMLANIAPFNVTGHPAISLPCGVTDEGLPIGVMFVAKEFNEERLLKVSHAFENVVDWKA